MFNDNKIKLKSIFKGTLFSLILTVLLVLLITVVSYFWTLDNKLVSVLLFVSAVISVLGGSYIVSRVLDEKGMIHGGLLGIAYFLIILVSTFVLKGNFELSARSIIMFFAYICSGMLGGILGINSNNK